MEESWRTTQAPWLNDEAGQDLGSPGISRKSQLLGSVSQHPGEGENLASEHQGKPGARPRPCYLDGPLQQNWSLPAKQTLCHLCLWKPQSRPPGSPEALLPGQDP